MPAHVKNDRPEKRKTNYDIEKVAKILSLVAVPVVIAIFGWIIQNTLSERSLSQEYVKLAVSILEKPKSSDVPAGLRDWAVDLLNQNSPTKFSPETIRQLKTGEINLSGFIRNLIATSNNGGGIAISPDAKTVATGQTDGLVAIWDLKSGLQLMTFMGHNAAVTAVVYSPDAKMIYSGSIDNTVRLWELQTGREIRLFRLRSPVVGLAPSPDAKSLGSKTILLLKSLYFTVTEVIIPGWTFTVTLSSKSNA